MALIYEKAPKDDGIVGSLWHVLLIIYMPMSEEVALATIHQQGVSLHDWEIEQHLIDLRITVATHGDNLVCQSVETLHDTFWVDALRDAIARTIVDDVTHDAHHIAMALLEEVERFLQGWQTAMYI